MIENRLNVFKRKNIFSISICDEIQLILSFILIFFSSLLDNVNCQNSRLEILPTQSPQRRPVGKQMMVTCQAKVDNPDLITDLRWRGQDGMNIMPKQ